MNSPRINLAQQMATQHHVFNGRQLYGNLPYTHHLQAVAQTVEELMPFNPLDEDDPTRGVSADTFEDLVVAAWLHDILEDTALKPKDLVENFGERVATLVEAVTNSEGVNRAARHALTYPRTRANPYAVALKLCDRIANVRAGGSLVKAYRKEQEDFRRALYTPGQWEGLWEELERSLINAHIN